MREILQCYLVPRCGAGALTEIQIAVFRVCVIQTVGVFHAARSRNWVVVRACMFCVNYSPKCRRGAGLPIFLRGMRLTAFVELAAVASAVADGISNGICPCRKQFHRLCRVCIIQAFGCLDDVRAQRPRSLCVSSHIIQPPQEEFSQPAPHRRRLRATTPFPFSCPSCRCTCRRGYP